MCLTGDLLSFSIVPTSTAPPTIYPVSLTMSSLQAFVFVLLVDNLFQFTRNMFSVKISSDAHVEALAKEVRGHLKPSLDHLQTSAMRLYRFSDKASKFEFDDESRMLRLVSEAFSNDHLIFLCY